MRLQQLHYMLARRGFEPTQGGGDGLRVCFGASGHRWRLDIKGRNRHKNGPDMYQDFRLRLVQQGERVARRVSYVPSCDVVDEILNMIQWAGDTEHPEQLSLF